MSDYKLKVTTEVLREVASEVYENVSNTRSAFDEIRNIVNSSRSHWEGYGNEAYLKSFFRKTDRINEALRRFTENASDLEKMAGIYESVERENTSITEGLPQNVIS